jgi:hypothetical protein
VQTAVPQADNMLRRTLPSTAAGKCLRRYASNSGNAADPNSTRRPKFRLYLLTGAVTLITVVGVITGSSLKADREAVTQRRKAQEVPVVQRIAMIDARRAELLRTKADLERKLDRLQARMRSDAVSKEEGQQGN